MRLERILKGMGTGILAGTVGITGLTGQAYSDEEIKHDKKAKPVSCYKDDKREDKSSESGYNDLGPYMLRGDWIFRLLNPKEAAKDNELIKIRGFPKYPVEHFLKLLGKERTATIKNLGFFMRYYKTSGAGSDILCEIYENPEAYLKRHTTLKPGELITYVKNLPEKDKKRLEEDYWWKIDTKNPSLDDAFLVYTFREVAPTTFSSVFNSKNNK